MERRRQPPGKIPFLSPTFSSFTICNYFCSFQQKQICPQFLEGLLADSPESCQYKQWQLFLPSLLVYNDLHKLIFFELFHFDIPPSRLRFVRVLCAQLFVRLNKVLERIGQGWYGVDLQHGKHFSCSGIRLAFSLPLFSHFTSTLARFHCFGEVMTIVFGVLY